jgi:hypothetical protein
MSWPGCRAFRPGWPSGRIVLLTADGMPNAPIAGRRGVAPDGDRLAGPMPGRRIVALDDQPRLVRRGDMLVSWGK